MANKNSKKGLVKHSNELSESRKDWTILEARIYCRVIDIFQHKVDIWRAEKNIPSNMEYKQLFPELPLQELLSQSIPRWQLAVTGKDGKTDMPTIVEFKKAFDRLSENKVIVGNVNDEENWKKINIIGSVCYDPARDSMKIYQDPGTIEYLLELKDQYTTINPWMVMKFQKSKYTFPFYEWCCQWKKKGAFELTIPQIKHRLKIDEYEEKGKVHKEKYKVVRDFIKNVIEPPMEELQELFDAGECDVCFTYEIPSKFIDSSKPGRKTIKGFRFVVTRLEKPKEISKPKQLQLNAFFDESINQRLLVLKQTLIYHFSHSYDKEWPARAINELGKIVKYEPKLLDKVEKQVSDTFGNDYTSGKVKNPQGAIRGYFKRTLKIDVDKKEIKKGES